LALAFSPPVTNESRRHDPRLSENVRNLNRGNAYPVFNSHRLPNARYAASPSRQLTADCPSTQQWLLRSQVPHATLFLVEGSNVDSNGERRWHVPEAFVGLYAAK
jgi:hypothetical protein